MGNSSSVCKLRNHSKRNVRVFVTESALEIDAFITSSPGSGAGGRDEPPLPAPASASASTSASVKTFWFRPDVDSVRVLASRSQEVAFESDCFLSVFAEDVEDETVCSRQIAHNVALSGPTTTLLLFDV